MQACELIFIILIQVAGAHDLQSETGLLALKRGNSAIRRDYPEITPCLDAPDAAHECQAQVWNKALDGHGAAEYALTLPEGMTIVTVMMDRLSAVGDPDLKLYRGGTKVASDTNQKHEGRHTLSYDSSLTAAGSSFVVQIQNEGSVATTFSLTVVVGRCHSSFQHPTSSYFTIPILPCSGHGTCSSNSKCMCGYDANSSSKYMLKDCSGLNDHDVLTIDNQQLFTGLRIDSGIGSQYYNFTITDDTYEAVVSLTTAPTLADGSPGGSAQFAIAVDKFPHGAWWHANYHPRISGDVQSIKLTRSILDGNEDIMTSGTYVAWVQFAQGTNATATGTVFDLTLAEYACPDDCSGSGVCDPITHMCTCRKGFTGADCEGDTVPLVPAFVNANGETVLEGMSRSGSVNGGSFVYFQLPEMPWTGAMELFVNVTASLPANFSHSALTCHSVPVVSVHQGSPPQTPSGVPTGASCSWRGQQNSSWTEIAKICGNQFELNPADTPWFITVYADGHAKMPFTIKASIYESLVSLEIAALEAQVLQLEHDNSSKMAGGVVAAISIATFILGGGLFFVLGKMYGMDLVRRSTVTSDSSLGLTSLMAMDTHMAVPEAQE